MRAWKKGPLLAQEGWREAPGWSLTENHPTGYPAGVKDDYL